MPEETDRINYFNDSKLRDIIYQNYSKTVTLQPLVGYDVLNFLLTGGDNEKYICKITTADSSENVLRLQMDTLTHLNTESEKNIFPKPLSNNLGDVLTQISDDDDNKYFLWILSYLEGEFLVNLPDPSDSLFISIGSNLAYMDTLFDGFYHPYGSRDILWDLKNSPLQNNNLDYVKSPDDRRLIEYFLYQFERHVIPELPGLRKSLIQNNANDYNILTRENKEVCGIIDFGDMVYSCTIFELAIALAYIMLDKDDPLEKASLVVKGYNEYLPLTETELNLLYYMVSARLCTTLCMAALKRAESPENAYLFVSEKPARKLLHHLLKINPVNFYNTMLEKINETDLIKEKDTDHQHVLDLRRKYVSPSLSISYSEPLKIVKGAMQYLYDDKGATYLDCVNNVCHVGHCHPRVVKAANNQMAELNTNTRYLHDNLVNYAQKLSATLPDPLEVCFFVCSGSEANDLALRLARTFTGKQDVIVIDGAYHGTTAADIAVSPYKFNGPGGRGKEEYIHNIRTPDIFRNAVNVKEPNAAEYFAKDVDSIIDNLKKNGKSIAAYISESIMGVAGQIVLPEGYLEKVYTRVRDAGGICIADEVQVGFGRIGSHFWSFETQNVIPDIITIGKPIGNGHPLAAVITTHEIADYFNNGMEYFNTFGGNPVSCAVGLEVLQIIADEDLQQNAFEVGQYLKSGLDNLKEKHSFIGDVRGMGLFLGIELVTDIENLTPAAKEAELIVNEMKQRYVLLSTDGPHHNILKIKPPIVFSKENADTLITGLDEVLGMF